MYGPIVAEMYARYAGYESLGSITRWLNERNVPTPWNATRKRNGKPTMDTTWKSTSVRKILASPATLGATVKTDGTSVTDADGVVIYRADGIVERDVWERVQARLRANAVSAKVNTWPLTGIAFCATCGGPMYSSSAEYGGKVYRYLCCVHSLRRDGLCTARRVKAEDLETELYRQLLALVGHRELTHQKLIPGRDFTEETNRVVEQMTHLYKEIQLGALAGEDVRDKQAALLRGQEQLARLHALTLVHPRVEPVGTGQTFRQRWESFEAAARKEFLRASDVRVVVSRDSMPAIEHQDRPLTTLDIPRMAIIDKPGLYAVIYLGSLGDTVRQAGDMAATAPAT